MEHLTLAKKVKHILRLSNTDLEIIHLLSRDKKLLVSEIAIQTRRSKRHVCQRLSFLMKKGFLERDLQVLHNKCLAYRYSLKSIKHVTKKVRVHLLNELAKIDALNAE